MATDNERKIVQCPFCGHRTTTTCIGVIYCGPHQLSDGYYLPARAMREVEHSSSLRAVSGTPVELQADLDAARARITELEAMIAPENT